MRSLSLPNVPSPSGIIGSSCVSHGFFRLEAAGWVALSASTVGGMSMMPGIGAPLLMRATISAKDVGNEGLGSASALAALPPACGSGADDSPASVGFGAGNSSGDREARCALYASKSIFWLVLRA